MNYTIHKLLNILRARDKQAIKFSQLIEYKMRIIACKKLYTKYCGEASPRRFYKNSKLSIFLHQQPEIS